MQLHRRVFTVALPVVLTLLLVAALGIPVNAAVPFAPDRKPGEGEGPFETLIILGAIVIDGTGAPPRGPMDIVISGNKIVTVGRTGDIEGAKVIDATGMYVLPGFVDTHAHIGGSAQGVSSEYVFKLWMAHGVTTIREPGCFSGLDWVLHEKERSAKNEIVAPRIYAYVSPGLSWNRGTILTPEQGREYVRWAKEQGADGLKLRAIDPPIMQAIIEEAVKLGMGTETHLEQTVVSKYYLRNMAQWGLGTVVHWYGVPESLLEDRTVQHFRVDYNYNNEYHRFGEAGRLWAQAAPPGSETWYKIIDEFIEAGLTMTPTFTIYEACRDVTRVKNEEWHEKYTAPSLMDYFAPSPRNHGSFFFDWTTADEIAWKENFRTWMQFINDYKNRGGRVTTGSDAGFIYRTYGFGYIREFELLQEAGFHPLEVIRSATMEGAALLAEENNQPMTFGIIRPGMLADLVIVPENPLQNFKTLYGTGTMRLNTETGEVEYVGGVKYTIKDGIVYDAKQLLKDVEEMVRREKEARGLLE